jgi:hypothetical protein
MGSRASAARPWRRPVKPGGAIRSVLVAVAALAACGGGEDSGDGDAPASASERRLGTVTDSSAAAATAAPEPSLRTRRLLGDTVAFAQVSAILPVGDVLFVTDAQMAPHVSAWSLETGELIGRTGRHGQGPREFVYPDWMLRLSPDSASVLVFDFKNRRFTSVTAVPGAVSGDGAPGELRIDSSFPFNPDMEIERPIPVAGGYLSNAVAADDALVRLDRAGRVERRVAWPQPFTERESPHGVGRSLLNRNFIGATPSRDRFALAYQFANRVVLFGEDGSPYATARGPRETVARYHFEDNRFVWDDGNEMAYWDVQLTDRRVYALFCGCRLGDDDHQLPREIHVFDLDGTFQETLRLDRPVSAFAVSPDGRRLYGAVETPHPLIAEWVLDSTAVP